MYLGPHDQPIFDHIKFNLLQTSYQFIIIFQYLLSIFYALNIFNRGVNRPNTCIHLIANILADSGSSSHSYYLLTHLMKPRIRILKLKLNKQKSAKPKTTN